MNLIVVVIVIALLAIVLGVFVHPLLWLLLLVALGLFLFSRNGGTNTRV